MPSPTSLPGQTRKSNNILNTIVVLAVIIAGYLLYTQVFHKDQSPSTTPAASSQNSISSLDLSTTTLTGTLPDSNLSSRVTLQGNSFNGASQLLQLTTTGALPVLDGSNLTNVKSTAVATTLDGHSSAYFTNASNLSSGTVADARLSGSVTLQGNSFNGASQLLQLAASGLIPVLNGSNLTSVNASLLNGQLGSFYTNATNISSGTLGDSRLSTNVALLNGTQSFTGNNTFTGTVLSKNASNSSAAFQIQNSGGVNLLTVDTTGSGAITISALGSSTYSDEFNSGGPTADAKWTFSTPGVSGTYDVNSTTAGKLHFATDASNHDCWAPSLQVNCVMLLETPPTGDFQAEVKIDTTPTNLQAPGITVYKDANNYIRFEYEYASGSLHYLAHKVIAGVGTSGILDCAAGSASVYIRAIRSTDTWTLAYSTDGNSFTTCGSFTQALDLSVGTAGIGPSYNGGTGAAAFAGDIDYFRLSLPNSGVFKTTTSNLFQNAADSTTSFRIQNSAGTTILGIDTVDGRIFSSITDSATAVGFTLNTAALSTSGAKLIAVKNNGTEKYAIDKDGRVVTALVPAVHVYNSTDQSIASGSLSAALAFDTERFDTDSLHAGGANTRLTASVAGKYNIYFTGAFEANSTGVREFAMKLTNGSDNPFIADSIVNATSSLETISNLNTTYQLAAGDYLEIFCYQNSGSPLNVKALGNRSAEFGMTYLGP